MPSFVWRKVSPSSTLKMDTAGSPETCNTIRRINPEYQHINLDHRGDLKFQIPVFEISTVDQNQNMNQFSLSLKG